MDDIQLDGLGDPLALRLLLGIQLEQGAAMHDVTGAQHGTIDGQTPVLDPGGQARAGMFGKELCGDLVEALTAQLEGDFGTKSDGLIVVY
ncbi:hypothetical protein GCM10027398_31260 [Azotobacter salinestris]